MPGVEATPATAPQHKMWERRWSFAPKAVTFAPGQLTSHLFLNTEVYPLQNTDDKPTILLSLDTIKINAIRQPMK